MYPNEGSCLGFEPHYRKVFRMSWLKSSDFSQSPSDTFSSPSSSLSLGHGLADQTQNSHWTSSHQGVGSDLLSIHDPTSPVQPEWEKSALKEGSPILHTGAKPAVLPRGFGCPSSKTSNSNKSFGPKCTVTKQKSPFTPQSCLSPSREQQGQGKVTDSGSETQVNPRQLPGRFLCPMGCFST